MIYFELEPEEQSYICIIYCVLSVVNIISSL